MKDMKFQRILFCVVVMSFFLLSSSFSAAYEKEVSDLCGVMSEKIIKTGKKSIAVVDFTDLQGNVTELGRFLAEEFSVKLAGMGKGFEVVDRTHLKSIIAEHKLSATGMIDPQTARQLGKFAGVNALLAGTITPFGDTIRLSLKVLDAESAKIITADTGNIPKTKAIEELLAGKIEPTITGTSPITIPQSGKTQSVEAKGFIFELKECKLSGQTVTCFMIITSKEKDAGIGIHHSRIFDDLGNEYEVSQTTIGKESANGSYGVSNTLIAGTPTKSSIAFEKFSKEATMIKTLVVGDSGAVKFYNIPLKK